MEEVLEDHHLNISKTHLKVANLEENEQKARIEINSRMSKTPASQERTFSRNSRKENSLNETFESYRAHYEDKIVEIFEQMDKIRG